MPPSLWTLIALNARAALRRMTRQARTKRGITFVAVGIIALALWLTSAVVGNHYMRRGDPTAIRTMGPVAILGICLLNVITSAGERAVTFSPAEVDFLFPGPFTRRQLLSYKLVKTGLAGIPSALLFGVVLGRYGGSYAGRCVAAWLTFQFVQMVAMTAALLQATAGERAFATGRRWALLGGLAVALALAAPVVLRHRDMRPAEIAQRVQSTTWARVALSPFGVFAQAVTADRLWPDGARWDALAMAIDGTLVAVVFSLDANYLETAAAASGKRYARLARLRQGGLAGLASPATAKLRVWMLPWLAGAGPVAWRQLTGVVRTSRGLLWVLAIVAIVMGATVARTTDAERSLATLVSLSVWANLFLTSMLRFDFRGDLDHLDMLRSLPLRPSAVAAAELVAPTVVLSAVQFLLLAAAATFGHLRGTWVMVGAAFVVPANAVLVGSENLLFLLFPSRPPAAVAGDMGMVGRQTILFIARLLILIVVAIGVGSTGYLAFLLGGHSPWIAGVAAWVPLLVAVGGIVLLMGMAYARFDPSVDTPT